MKITWWEDFRRNPIQIEDLEGEIFGETEDFPIDLEVPRI